MKQNKAGQDRTATVMKIGRGLAGENTAPANFPKAGRVSKAHPDYWAGRLYHEDYATGDGRREVPEYSVRIHYRGRRERFALHEGNKTKAATLARNIYAHLALHDWPATLAKFKPAPEAKTAAPTLGEYIRAAQAVATIAPATFNTYAVKLRSIAAGVAGLKARKEERPVLNPATGKPRIDRRTGKPRTHLVDPRFDAHQGGADAWRAKVDALRLDRLTPEAVQKWIASRLKAHTDNPAKLAAARVTLNSLVRCAGSLFTKRILRHLRGTLALPSPLPFEGVEKPRAIVRRYESKIAPQLLHAKAEAELRDATGDGQDALDRRECYAVYLLALFAGLRRDEMDTLTWEQIDFGRGLVHVETNEHTAVKTATSQDTVQLTPDVAAFLAGKFARRSGPFVIESPNLPRPDALRYHHYRCNRLFTRLIAWLRKSGGVTARNPLHTLRKEFGSYIARHFGIQAASEALRHGSISMTWNHYVGMENKASFGPAMLARTGTEGGATPSHAPAMLNVLRS